MTTDDSRRERWQRWLTTGRRPLIVTAAVVVLLALFLVPQRVSRVATVDESTRWRSGDAPPLREVVWNEPHEIEIAPGDAGEVELVAPRLSDNGGTLFFTRRDADGTADVFVSRLRDGTWSDPEPLTAVNTAADELGPTPSRDGRRLYFYSNRPGGRGGYDLYVADRTGDGWSRPRNLGPSVNSAADEYDPAPTPNGLGLFFASNRVAADGDESNTAETTSDEWSTTLRARRNSFDLFHARRNADDEEWKSARAVDALNRADSNEGAPYVSPDGAFVYFASDRPARPGEPRNLDLYRSRWRADAFGEPVNLGASVNTDAHETEPGLSPEGFTLVFASDRTGSDRLYASRASEVYHHAEWEAGALASFLRAWWLPILLTLLLLALALALLYWRGAIWERARVSRFVLGSVLLHALLLLLLAWWTLPGIIRTLADEGDGGPLGVPLPSRESEGGREAYEEVAEIDPVPQARLDSSAALPASEVPPDAVAVLPRTNQDAVPFRRAPSAQAVPVRAARPEVPRPRPQPMLKPLERRTPTPSRTPVEIAEASLPDLPEPVDAPAEPTPVAASPSEVERTAPEDTVSAVSPAPPPTPSENAAGPSRPAVPFEPASQPRRVAAAPSTTPPALKLPASRATAATTVAEIDSEPPPLEPVTGDVPAEPRTPRPEGAEVAFAKTADEPTFEPADSAPSEASDAPAPARKPSLAEFGAAPNEPTSPADSAAAMLAPSPLQRPRAATPETVVAQVDFQPELPAAPNEAVADVDAPSPVDPAGEPATELDRAAAEETAFDPLAERSPDVPAELPRRSTELASVGAPPRVKAGPEALRAVRGPLRKTPKTTRLKLSRERASLASLLALRQGSARMELVTGSGGDAGTERAVRLGLKWLAEHQNEDGSWSLHEFHRDGEKQPAGKYKPGNVKSDTAATGLALLPFLAAGHTYLTGEYKETVERGLEWLVDHQQPDGDLFVKGSEQHWMYSHGIAAIALCEAHGLEVDDGRYRDPAVRALKFIEQAQNPQTGGWRYKPWQHDKGQKGDTSVVGWQVMALKSGEMAGLDVAPAVYERTRKWLRSVESNQPVGGHFGYTGPGAKPAMTAEAVLCLQYLGIDRNDPRTIAGADYLVDRLPEKNQRDTSYSWYYATQVMFHMQGDYWERWNPAMKEILKTTQETSGPLAGSWDPHGGDNWEKSGGRLYATTLKLLMLEVYYRHLPLFDQLAE